MSRPEVKEVPESALYAEAGKIRELLSKFTRKQQREILALAASPLNLRVVPAGPTPNMGGQQSSNRANKPAEKKEPALQRSSFDKKDPEWIRLQTQRSTIVEALKVKPEDKSSLAQLRSVESEIKTLKQKLQGKVVSS